VPRSEARHGCTIVRGRIPLTRNTVLIPIKPVRVAEAGVEDRFCAGCALCTSFTTAEDRIDLEYLPIRFVQEVNLPKRFRKSIQSTCDSLGHLFERKIS